MMVWINGTFGVGKSSVARALAGRRDRLRLFDPEWVGYLLTSHLKDDSIADFQDLPGWRRLVPTVAAELADHAGEDLVAAQTVLTERYWDELRAGLVEHGFEVVHVVLDADEETLRRRIEADVDEADARGWRLDHIAPFVSARPWLHAAADLVVDTSQIAADETATAIQAALGHDPLAK